MQGDRASSILAQSDGTKHASVQVKATEHSNTLLEAYDGAPRTFRRAAEWKESKFLSESFPLCSSLNPISNSRRVRLVKAETICA